MPSPSVLSSQPQQQVKCRLGGEEDEARLELSGRVRIGDVR
jgi:hypothetical protein